MIFKRPKNTLEGNTKQKKNEQREKSRGDVFTCPGCKKMHDKKSLSLNAFVCPHCGYHFRIGARLRLSLIADKNTFVERDKDLLARNYLNFTGYDEKLKAARLESGEKDGVICGTCEIGGIKTAIFLMEPRFMMGSMGSVVGEKITRLFEYATKHALPVVGFTLSGGARMQEGILSLMQMAKTSGAIKYHSDGGNLYICVLTDPTTGGVTASFAMEGDINIGEPGALIGFAGPRVIEQTMRKKLPAGFQRSEFLLEKGFLDMIVSRREEKTCLQKLLRFHERRKSHDCLS